VCYMSDREIQVPEVEGKTIRSMRLTLTSSAETEIQIDFHRRNELFQLDLPQGQVRRGTIYRWHRGVPNP
jgi:hypothetical protein